MLSFTGNRLAALALLTAIQILNLQPVLAYPIHQGQQQRFARPLHPQQN